jgi:hypothetical protein
LANVANELRIADRVAQLGLVTLINCQGGVALLQRSGDRVQMGDEGDAGCSPGVFLPNWFGHCQLPLASDLE